MAEENKVVEQEQEHVSENPNIKDTEHVESTEVPPVATEENVIEVDQATNSEDEIVPHEKSVQEITEQANKMMEEKRKTEGDENSSVYIDMSKIEMDKDGIPVITRDDINRLKASEITVSDFEYEIRESREVIFEMRKLLNESEQDKRENFCKEQIEKIDARLKEIEALKDEELTDEIKHEKEDITVSKSIFADEIANLPKHNEKIKQEILKREANAKKHIATYQNVARNELGKLVKDGTIAGLISSTTNTAFSQAFVDTMRIAKGEKPLDELDEIKKIKKENGNDEYQFQLIEIVKNGLDDLKEGDIDFLISYMKKDYEKEYSEEVKKEINYEDISKVPSLVNDISKADPKDQDKLYEKYQEIRNSVISIKDPNEEFEELKNARREADEFFDKIEKFSRGKITINQYYQFGVGEPLKKLIPDITKDTNVEEIKAIINEIDPIITKKYDDLDKKQTEVENKIDEIREKNIKPYKDYMVKNGIFNSFITYSFINAEKRGYYGRPESALELQHIKNKGKYFYDVIRMNMKDNTDESYNTAKINVNSITMVFSNFIKYFIDLYEEKIDIEWAANFDPDSILKNFYYEHKEKLDPIIKDYVETRNVFSHLLIHNIKFTNAYQKLINDIITDVNSANSKLKKLNENKHVKNKYEFMTDIAFEYQFINSFKAYIDKSEKVVNAVSEKREKEPNITYEEFDKWYNENLLSDELEATAPVISSFLHLMLGCTVLHGFVDFDNYFASKNKNKVLKNDCMNYFINQYILESFAFKNCAKDKTFEEYIRERSKTISFQSIDYSYQRDVDIDETRFTTISYIIGYATNCFKVLFDNVVVKDEEKKTEKEVKVNKNKEKQEKYKNMINEYKRKGKEKKKNLNSFKNSISQYNEIINNIKCDNSLTKFTDNENIYEVSVYPSKDTKVIVRIERYSKKIKEEEIKKIFETAIIDKNQPVNVKEAFLTFKKVTNDQLTNINEKWYYNQYVDELLAKRDDKPLSAIDSSTFTLSERCRYMLDKCLKNSFTKIIENATSIIKHTGVNFEGKTISVKNNCKFDIKYFKPNNTSNFYGGNLNFVKAGLWDIVTFELNYDIVNEKK